MNRWLRLFWPTSRKARVLLVVLVIGAALILIKSLFFRLEGKRPPIDEGLVLKLHQDQLERLREDSDGDGLKNWEEILYQTDVMNADTDSDGTADGEEIKQDRDPALKGPNDHFATSTPLGMTSASKDPETNYTRDFTRKFLRGPVSQIVAGGKAAIDAKAVERYAQKLSKESVLADAPRFTVKDVRLDSTADTAAVTRYLDASGRIFGTLDGRGRNEIGVIADALTSEDYGPIADLAAYPTAYQKAISDLLALRVPQRFAQSHIAMLNHLSRFKRSAELMQRIETDPVLAILALQERVKLNDEFVVLLGDFRSIIATELKK